MLHNFMKCFSGTQVTSMFECLIVLFLQFIIFGSVKLMFTKVLLKKEIDDAGNFGQEYF